VLFSMVLMTTMYAFRLEGKKKALPAKAE
jgi:hypothetical protein